MGLVELNSSYFLPKQHESSRVFTSWGYAGVPRATKREELVDLSSSAFLKFVILGLKGWWLVLKLKTLRLCHFSFQTGPPDLFSPALFWLLPTLRPSTLTLCSLWYQFLSSVTENPRAPFVEFLLSRCCCCSLCWNSLKCRIRPVFYWKWCRPSRAGGRRWYCKIK